MSKFNHSLILPSSTTAGRSPVSFLSKCGCSSKSIKGFASNLRFSPYLNTNGGAVSSVINTIRRSEYPGAYHRRKWASCNLNSEDSMKRVANRMVWADSFTNDKRHYSNQEPYKKSCKRCNKRIWMTPTKNGWKALNEGGEQHVCKKK